MANLKECSDCGIILPADTQNFHRCKDRPDGLLGRCKSCQNKRSAEYRKGKGKDYWFDDNGKDGWFRKNKKRWAEYVSEKYAAHFNCKIYAIVNPEGQVYIGLTQHPLLSRRMTSHKNDYNQFLKGNRKHRIPGLWDSVDKWGWPSHTAILIEEMDTNDREKGKEREAEYIQQYMQKGVSLNKNL